MKGSVKDRLRPLLILVLWIGSYLVPKKANYFAFLPGHDKGKFDGNLKWLILYLQKKHPEISTVWLTDSSRVAQELTNRGVPTVTYRFFPIWQILRAQTIFIDTRHFSLAAGRLSIVQLWHGTGLKTMAGASAQKSRFKALLGQSHYAKYQLVTTTSPSDSREKDAMFGSPNNCTTGYPRNDIFFGEIFDRQAYKQELGLAKFEKLILYAPTFRDHGQFKPFSSAMWNQLDQLMKQQNGLFVVKKHPGDRKLEVPTNLDNVVDLTATVGDVQELLAATDTLITDYSTIVTDYALSGNPIIFYTFDLDSYVANSRPLADDFYTVLPGPFASTEEELFALLEDGSWFHDRDYQENYSRFVSHYHTHRDSQSCQRVIENLR